MMRRLLHFQSKNSSSKAPTEPSVSPPPAEPTAIAAQRLQVVSEETDPVTDYALRYSSIVAVYGLNGHCEKTWTAGNGVNWLRDLLPQARG
ncbi:uncharacterized protein BDZ99DRAFT_438751 [Mytilinidion resinicola]|uniref:Uncharacterized protein n=1 Tax=Mytilinidion resinicola TaxID=574789 RepID=A0A6A6YYE5_9PEZI|nr:uncharacterized protein BDZ99DRAFT_438751 [Mytilinidion resinicola]KAF2813519.1 hypothetical protein BDZ99DRAFT_438751 [Mytilinidion resinicola]